MNLKYPTAPKASPSQAKVEAGFDQNRTFVIQELVASPVSEYRKFLYDGGLSVEDRRSPSGNKQVRSYTITPRDLPSLRLIGLLANNLSWTFVVYTEVQKSDPDAHAHFNLDYANEIFWAPAEDFVLIGVQSFGGINCVVVRSPIFQNLLYFRATDSQLCGVSYSARFNGTSTVEKFLTSVLGNDRAETDDVHFINWYSQLDQTRRLQIARACANTLKGFDLERIVRQISDYKEVVPGRQIPMKSTIRSAPARSGSVTNTAGAMNEDVLLFEMDRSVPESLFRIEMDEGITVRDSRYGPTITYPYSKSRTEAELRAIAARAPAAQRGRR